MKKALSQPRFRYDGAKYTIPYPGFKTDQAHPVNHPDYVDQETGELRYISTYPRPRQTPYPPLWQVVDSPSSIEFAAKNDLGIIMWRPPVEALRERCRLYQESARSVGVDLPFGARTGISRDVHIASSREEARRIAEKGVMDALNFSNWRGPRIFLRPGETFAPGQEDALKKKLSFEFVDERSPDLRPCRLCDRKVQGTSRRPESGAGQHEDGLAGHGTARHPAQSRALRGTGAAGAEAGGPDRLRDRFDGSRRRGVIGAGGRIGRGQPAARYARARIGS